MSPRRPDPAAASPGIGLAAVEEMELVIEKLVAGGDGLGRFEGIPVFVPRSAPGDRLRVRLVERRPDYGRAEIVEVLAPGAGRRSPPCPYFSRCGGCDLQHLDDRLQSRLKAAAVKETLERLGGIAWPEAATLVVGEPWGYRLRTQLHTGQEEGRIRVGYYARRSHQLVAVESCPILVPELEGRLAALPASLPPEPPQRLELAVGDDGRLTAAPPLPALPGGEVELTAAGFRYAFDARCFFQVHRGLVEELVAAVVGEWEGEAACDLYGGVGLFALPLARRYRRVTLVEGDRVAARFARINARRNRVGAVEVVAQAVESWVAALPAGADRVVVDPPRAGLGRAVRRALLERRPRRLTYASCHPAALARDLAALAGAYRLESLTLLDLFPQTGHIESVVQLVGA
jgi:23S rRNA (uracil1939-C5)-methyltransferase